MTDNIETLIVDTQPVELCKLLKIANMVSGGGEAKIVISEGYVLVNGEVEYQKRKKIYHDDIVEFNGEAFQVNVIECETVVAKTVNNIQPKAQKANQQKTSNKKTQRPSKAKQNQQNRNENMPVKSKRKAISF